MVAEPDEGPGWRVRVGVSLLQFTPMSPERRALFDKEEERERRALEDEAGQRRAAALERRQEMEFRGTASPRSHAEVLQAASFGMDRADAAERRREEQAAELLGKPRPTYVALLREAKEARKEREAAAEVEPASKAELDRGLKKLALTVSNTFGKKLLS
jgi:hypothetical protein